MTQSGNSETNRSSSAGYALFDLDHTILPYDTQAFFCNFVLKRHFLRRIYLLWFLPCALLSAFRIFSLRTMKRVFSSYLWGMPEAELHALVDEFLETEFAAAVYPEVIAEVTRNRKEGRILILNSASPEFYLEKISKQLGFDHFLGTQMITEDPMPFLPRIVGPNNKHGAKITAMIAKEIIPPGEGPLPDSIAYSDSSADIPLLSHAEKGVMIHPGEALRAAGTEKEWTTMTPLRPYRGKWGARVTNLRQAFGLWPLAGKH